MLTRTIQVRYKPEPPQHRARDSTDLSDPLLHAMMRAKRGQAKSVATKEQTLAEMVLAMRLVDAGKR
jgi:hypothetical protein